MIIPVSPAASSLYIHIPFCVSKCSYCDFFSVPSNKDFPPVPDAYIAALCRDISMQHEKQFLGNNLKTIYFGGGTPSLMTNVQLQTVMRHIEKTCAFSSTIEITLEANPAQINLDFIFALKDCGINRLSLGVQSFSGSVIQSCGRSEKNGNIFAVLDLLDAHWNGKMSIDLIAGLENETEKTLLAGIDAACSHSICHLSFYALTNAALKTEEKTDELWLSGIERLCEKGFTQYEVSNFARNAESYCAHNLAYWHLLPYCGAGSGSAGTVFAKDNSALRYTQSQNIGEYINNSAQCETEFLSKKTILSEYLMLGFRLTDGISSKVFFDRFALPLETVIGAHTETGAFCRWQKKGLAEKKAGNYRLTKNGLLFLNQFLQEIM